MHSKHFVTAGILQKEGVSEGAQDKAGREILPGDI